jgi:FeS assembly SUF system regulator
MLRISRLTDYAFILLAELEEADDDVVPCSTLAEQSPLPLPTVRKVAKKLAAEDLLVSHQGAHGGYELASPPDELSAAEVISAMEGPIAVTVCSEDATECEIADGCPTSQSWKIINAALRATLEGLTLDDMTPPLDQETLLEKAGLEPPSTTEGTVTAPDTPRRSNA